MCHSNWGSEAGELDMGEFWKSGLIAQGCSASIYYQTILWGLLGLISTKGLCCSLCLSHKYEGEDETGIGEFRKELMLRV